MKMVKVQWSRHLVELEACPARCRGIFLKINLLYIVLLYGILYTVYIYEFDLHIILLYRIW